MGISLEKLLRQLGINPGDIAVDVPAGRTPFYGFHSEDTEGTQSFTVPAGTNLDQRTSFVVGSVIVDNNTSAWINVPDATKDGTGRFVPPGGGAAIPILGHISRARINWTAPAGKVQPAFVAGEQAVVVFLASAIPPGFGIPTANPPPRWAIISNPATGSLASATKAASPGVTHVADNPNWTITQTGAAAAAPTALVRDGASGVGTAIFQDLLAIPATVGAADHKGTSQLGEKGTAGNAMTIEFNTAVPNVNEAVNLIGYDL